MRGTTTYGCLLVGTDGSDTAAMAVERAVTLAAQLEARLLVAYVGDAEPGRAVLDAVEAAHAGRGVAVEGHLLRGDPADALLGLSIAEGVDLIVVGNKGMTGAQRFLLGSVPNKVSHQSTVDVLIVHTTG